MMNWFSRDITEEEERHVAAFMARLEATPVGEPRFPNPEVIWWKARLLERWDAERKVQRPLDVMEPIQFAGALMAAGVLIIWSLPSLIRFLSLLSN